MRPLQRSRIAAIAVSIVLATAISSCSTVEKASQKAPAPYSAQQSVEEFAGMDFDYDPVASPEALAEESRLVVTGTIDRVQAGRVQIVPGNDTIPGVSTIVLVLRDPQAVMGSLNEGADGSVYVELPNPGGQDPDVYTDGLPPGSAVVAYLVPAADGAASEAVDVVIADPKAGRPEGQALYLTAGPQGLILQYENEAVVWPLIGEKRDGSLDDTLPGGNLIAG